MEIIKKYLDKPWDWESISSNPNINIEIIEKYPDKPWDWEWISRNEFLYNKIVYKREIKKDIKNRQQTIKNILNKYLYKDLIHVLNDFIYWN